MSDATLRAPSRTQQAYEELRDAVLSCRYSPGSRLHIGRLSESLGVSQGAIREALARLSSEGFVRCEPQRGFRVAPTDAADVLFLTRARADIEGLCLRSSIAHGDTAWEARSQAAFCRLCEVPMHTPDGEHFSEDFVAANAEFLDALVSACDNPWLSEVRKLLCAQSLRYRPWARPGNDHTLQGQEQILRHALTRDGDAAAAELSRYMLARAQAIAAELERTMVPGRADAHAS